MDSFLPTLKGKGSIGVFCISGDHHPRGRALAMVSRVRRHIAITLRHARPRNPQGFTCHQQPLQRAPGLAPKTWQFLLLSIVVTVSAGFASRLTNVTMAASRRRASLSTRQ
jgi:hypothetical protein